MKKQLIIFISGFILLFVFGGIMSLLIKNEEKAAASIIHLADEVGAKKMVKDEVTFLEEVDTKIIEKYNVTNRKGELVALIYVGKTKGYAEDLVVAYAIDVKLHKVIGMKIISSNETEHFLAALYANQTYLNQFTNMDLTKVTLEVETFSGATPNGGNGVVAPATSKGLQKVLQLVRKQYDQDTEFSAPTLIELVSKEQSFSALDKFKYKFTIAGVEVECVVNLDYSLDRISNDTYQTLVMEAIVKNKMTNYINSATLSGATWTIILHSQGYHGVLVSTATVSSAGVISSFITDLNDETFTSEYNPGYTGDSFAPVFSAVEDHSVISPVSGATITSEGIIAARDLLYSFIEGGFGQ